MRRHCASIAICLLLAGAAWASPSDFATELVSYAGPLGAAPYSDPNSVLGKPTTEVFDIYYGIAVKTSLAYAAFNVDPNAGWLVTTLGNEAYITVKFDHKVVDHPGNWYGHDFIVYGNAFFRHSDLNPFVYHDTNMNTFLLADGTTVSEKVQVSVSSDGNTWYTYDDTGPYADGAFPTNPYAWDSDGNTWGEELDWTKPVDPNLTSSDFNGQTVAAAIDLYDGSAGGTSFDLAEATGLDTTPVRLSDGNTVQRKYFQYIRVNSPPEVFYWNGEIDAFSDIAVAPGYYPPVGDVNGDGNVDNLDISPFVTALTVDHAGFAALFHDGEYWAADVDGDGNVDNLDITPFVNLLTGGGSPVPEPASLLLVAVGATGALIRRRRY